MTLQGDEEWQVADGSEDDTERKEHDAGHGLERDAGIGVGTTEDCPNTPPQQHSTDPWLPFWKGQYSQEEDTAREQSSMNCH